MNHPPTIQDILHQRWIKDYPRLSRKVVELQDLMRKMLPCVRGAKTVYGLGDIPEEIVHAPDCWYVATCQEVEEAK